MGRKKVRFGGVEVREMSIDTSAHKQEVKNPQHLIKITSGKKKETSLRSDKSSIHIPGWAIWLIIFLVVAVILYLILSRKK